MARAAALLLACLAPAVAGVANEAASLRAKGGRFIRSLSHEHTLRICNAYPFTSALDVYLGNHDLQLSHRPLAYKQCDEFTPTLRSGDRIDFKVGDSSAGTFTISDLPSGDATLLLVIYRHDAVSTAVAFQSHIFEGLNTPQVAVLDTYKGKGASEVHIKDVSLAAPGFAKRDETLRFDSVVAVDSGSYELSLLQDAPNATAHGQTELVALPGKAYVVIRVGVDAKEGPSYPEELMIFPHSPKAALGAAPRGQVLNGATVAVLLSSLVCGLMAKA